MRLLSVELHNYRIHASRVVEFDPARTLVGGPNESGKSTLIEAVHRVLFLKAKGNTAEHRSLLSQLNPGIPEVRLAFEAGGKRYQLTKRFGPQGSTALAIGNAPPLQGEAAETELARVLGVQPGLAGKTMTLQWTHLWVWQGVAGTDPSAVDGCPHGALLQRLQSMGGAGVLQSDLDEAVAHHFAMAVAETFNQNGKPKVDSPLSRAAAALAEAESSAVQALERWRGLEATAASLDVARRGVEESEVRLRQLAVEEEELQGRLARVARLRQTEVEQGNADLEATRMLDEVRRIRDEVVALRRDLKSRAEALTPLEQAFRSADDALRAARLEAESAEARYGAAGETTRRARWMDEWAQARLDRFAARDVLADWTTKRGRVQELRAQETAARTRLAGLPKVDAKAVRRLQKLEGNRDTTVAALKAMAAGLEVVAADLPVVADGTPLAPGQALTFTDTGEVVVGAGVRLRILPGGGKSLTEARQNAAEGRRALQSALEELGVSTVESAASVSSERDVLEKDLKILDDRLQDLSADEIETRLKDGELKLAELEAGMSRLQTLLASDTPAEPEAGEGGEGGEARLWKRDAAEALEAAESEEKKARSGFTTARAWFEKAQVRREEARTAIEAGREERHGLEARLQALLGRHGDDSAIALALASGEARAGATRAALAQTRTALAELQPGLLDDQKSRLAEGRQKTAAQLAGYREQVTATATTLRLEGEGDPRGALSVAEARARSARAHLEAVRRHAEAQRLLDQLFSEERQALADLLTQPFQQRIARYLECLFGPGTTLHVRFAAGRFGELGLLRPTTHPGGAFTFERLSGGTREQTAVAVRLAMAEVLAEGHDGCLPVVLDDAFAYSDPDRVRRLQDMLYLASRSGLQVIVLSCNPADYSGLGAHTILLNRPPPAPVGTNIHPGAEIPERSEDDAASGG